MFRIHRFRQYSSFASKHSSALTKLAVGGVVVTGTTLLLYHQRVASADAPPSPKPPPEEPDAPNKQDMTYDWSDRPRVLAFGSNRFGLIAPDQADIESVRLPRPIKGLDGRILRDIAFAERHAAAIDSNGDLYQWGTGYAENCAFPVVTVNGQNLTRVALSENKVYALREDGQVLVLASALEQQEKDAAAAASMTDRVSPSTSRVPTSGWWWGWWSSGKTYKDHDAAQLMLVPFSTPDELVISLDAGDHHVVALSSAGNVYACAADAAGNRFGQLGQGHSDTLVVPTHLIPKDPANATNPDAITLPLSDASAYFQTAFTPIAKPDGLNADVKAKQISCGSRHTMMLTDHGVYGWGWNGWGQLAQSEFDGNWRETESSPVAIRGSREFTSLAVREVAAGGNSTAFVCEREDDEKRGRWEVWACGMGQWGQLGNGTWSHMRGLPVRIKRLSYLREYAEAYGRSVGIKPYPLTFGNTHAAVVLSSMTPDVPVTSYSAALTTMPREKSPLAVGSDVLTWGRNVEGQCGTGKSNNMCAPTNPPRSAELLGNAKVERLQVERKGRTVKDDSSTRPIGVTVRMNVKAQGDVTVIYDTLA